MSNADSSKHPPKLLQSKGVVRTQGVLSTVAGSSVEKGAGKREVSPEKSLTLVTPGS